jgi:MYXO-CTERM domain-containing protein
VIDTARNPFGITGGNGFGAFSVPSSFTEGANGYVSINFVAAPETSTWAMTLMGFAGLGWLARRRRRKLTPAWLARFEEFKPGGDWRHFFG